MPKAMRSMTVFSFIAAVAAAVGYARCGGSVWLSSAVTFGTVFYHLGIRLLVGAVYNAGMKNRADYTKKRYRLCSWESGLYQFLNVKQWKSKLPTYYPETFSVTNHTWDEIAQAMCQSELVHETNVILSFVPLFAVRWFGSFSVFFITSLGAAAFDSLFVIVQRYNRPRVVRLAERKRQLP